MHKPLKPKIQPLLDFPAIMSFQVVQSTSLWKKIVFVATVKEWTCREVIEHAISVTYHHLEIETMEKHSVAKDKRNF